MSLAGEHPRPPGRRPCLQYVRTYLHTVLCTAYGLSLSLGYDRIYQQGSLSTKGREQVHFFVLNSEL